MRLIAAALALLLSSVAIADELNLPLPPNWNPMPTSPMQRAPPRLPWGNGDYFPMAGPPPHYGWPGYCVSQLSGVGHPAGDDQYHPCGWTDPIPPFSINGGITFPFPGDPEYRADELEVRRRIILNTAFNRPPFNTTTLPTLRWQKIPDTEKGKTDPADPNDMPFPIWINRNTPQTPGSGMCTQRIEEGASRVINQGYCINQTGLNGPPAFGNIADKADVLSINIPYAGRYFPLSINIPYVGRHFPGTAGAGFPSGENQSWWVYYPREHFNGRVLLIEHGTKGFCSWATTGNLAGARPMMARALNEGFAVAMSWGLFCSRFNFPQQAGEAAFNNIRDESAMKIAFANTYGNAFEDYNVTGHSRGSSGRQSIMPYDFRFRVGTGWGITVNGTQIPNSTGFRALNGGLGWSPGCPGPPDACPPGVGLEQYSGPFSHPEAAVNGFFDNIILQTEGEDGDEVPGGLPGSRLNEAGIMYNDEVPGWAAYIATNSAAFNKKPRCDYESPCTPYGVFRAYNNAIKHTCRQGCDQGNPTGHFLVPPENFGGVHIFVNTDHPRDSAGHTMTPVMRARTLADLWQLGPRSRGRMKGGVH